MELLHIDRILGEMGNGCTEPLDALLGNNTRCVFKTFDNIQGNLSLVNELVSYQIAKRLDLPIPPGGIACLDSNSVVENTSYIPNQGIGFYSVRLDNILNLAHQSGVMLKKLCTNPDDFSKILLFDHLIYNADRNCGNALFDIRSKKLYIIDHTHCFNKQTIWDRFSLNQCMQDYDIVDTKIMEYNEHTYNMFFDVQPLTSMNIIEVSRSFKQSLDRGFFQEAVNNIPLEWEISCNDSNMLVEYLCYRLDNLENICKTISNYKEVLI